MPPTVIETSLPGVLILEPQLFTDDRGFFFESFNARDFEALTGLKRSFVQDNQSRSARGVVRGLHYQIPHPQGKVVRVVAGEIFDVAVDLRRDSPTFAQWAGVLLSGDNRRQLWVPEGFGHGFLVTSEHADVAYKTTGYRYPEHERTLLWNDPSVGIAWPLVHPVRLGPKDMAGRRLGDAELF